MIPTTSSTVDVSRHYASRRGRFISCVSATCVTLIAVGGASISAAAQTSSPSPIPAPAAQSEKPTPKRVVGYLQGSEPNFLLVLPPYPVLDSPQDAVDVATFRQMQVADETQRWKLALSRMERDVLDTAFEAKDDFNRPRLFNALP